MYHVGNVVVLRERERGGSKPGTSVLLATINPSCMIVKPR